jgi:prepilin-type N-terminal cleavage/methylation domain-containing protein
MKLTRYANLQADRPARAFTLIELLVVIAIIGILAALLLPTFNSAKSQGAEAVDINNLKQISAAVQMYAADNGDYLPAPNWLKEDVSGYLGWLYTLNSNAQGPSQFVITNGLIWPTLKDQRLYMCPMDYTNTPPFQQRDQQLSSYAINGAIIGFNRTNYPAEKLGARHDRSGHRPELFYSRHHQRSGWPNQSRRFAQRNIPSRPRRLRQPAHHLLLCLQVAGQDKSGRPPPSPLSVL